MTSEYKIYSRELKENGHLVREIKLPDQWRIWVDEKNFFKLDSAVGDELKDGGFLHQVLASMGSFSKVEHILSLRTSPGDEDGIWHDDGSRNFAFSLGLNLAAQRITGGELNFRLKGSHDTQAFPALNFGEMVIFLTGIWGYEHQVNLVKQGERLVAAGWCS